MLNLQVTTQPQYVSRNKVEGRLLLVFGNIVFREAVAR
jgi:hypothetical protein